MDIAFKFDNMNYDSELELNILSDTFETNSNHTPYLYTPHTPLISNIEVYTDEEVLCEYIDELYNTLYSILDPEHSKRQLSEIKQQFIDNEGEAINSASIFWISGIKSLSNKIYKEIVEF